MHGLSRIRSLQALGATVVLAACGAGSASAPGGSGGGGAADAGTLGALDGTPTADGGILYTAQSLPIEVLGPDGTSATVTLPTLTTTQAAALSLRLQVHALNFPGKASVQVNAASPIVLANPSAIPANQYDDEAADAGAPPASTANAILNPDVTIDQPGWSYGGIGGAFATLSLTVKLPAGALHAGDGNTIAFSFHQTTGFEGGSIGYRVLSLNLTDGSGATLLDPGFLASDDPSTWTPPSSDPADIAAGEALWRTQSLQASPLETTHVLNAHCTDCHTQDGRDLQYFGFSNRSIIVRSMFHGLTEKQGEQIASFIRTRPLAVVSRPWNPPFQPGPGLDAKPADQWAAGAGIEAAVADDSQTLTDLFPGGLKGSSPTAIDTIAQSDKAVNLRQVRVAMQLPDWNHWLPTTHPLDSVFATQLTGKVDADAVEFPGAPGPQVTYQAIRTKLLAEQDGGASTYTTALAKGESQSLYQNDLATMRNAVDGIVSSSADAATGDAATDARYSLALWDMVKQFELFLEFGQAELGTRLFPATAEARSWPTVTAGDASPHQLAGNDPGTPFPTLRTNLRAVYLASAWDYVQLLVNPGDKVTERTIPWEYVDGPIYHLDNDYLRRGEGLRAVAESLKKMTEHHTTYLASTGGVNSSGCPLGYTCWAAHDDYPLGLIATANVMANLDADTRAAAIDAVLRAWLAVMADPKYSPANWWTTYHAQDVASAAKAGTTASCEWDPAITLPTVPAGCAMTEVVPGMLWRDLPSIAALGADGGTLAQVVALAEKIWPGPTGAPNDWKGLIAN